MKEITEIIFNEALRRYIEGWSLKVFIFPYNSLILYDMVKRLGHQPLAIMEEISKRAKITTFDSPPYGITYKEPREALKYCSVDVPSGVRGRINLLAPLVQQADVAIFVDNSEIAFGSSGCARANEFAKYMIRQRNIPILSLSYPSTEEEAVTFVRKVVDFLKQHEGS